MALIFRNQGSNNLEGNQAVATKRFSLDGTENAGDIIDLGGLGKEVLVTNVYVVAYDTLPTGCVFHVGSSVINGTPGAPDTTLHFTYWDWFNELAGIHHISTGVYENFKGGLPLPTEDANLAVKRINRDAVAIKLDTLPADAIGTFDLVVEYTYLENKSGKYLS